MPQDVDDGHDLRASQRVSVEGVARPWQTVYSRWRLWCAKGIWTYALKVLSRKRQGVLRFIDA
jgi:hypothetical protein